MNVDSAMYSVKGIAILDNDGNRLIAKYFDDTFGTVKEQKAYEKNLFNKTHKANAEIILLDGMICVYRSNVDLFFYVMGGVQENELMLVSVLNCLYDSVSTLLRKQVEKKTFLDNLDVCLLAVDEIVDQGVIIECDSAAVVSRCATRGEGEMAFGDQTVGQLGMSVLKSAKDQFQWSLLK